MAFVAVAAIAASSISSCKTDEDEDNKKTNTNTNGQSSGATIEAFHDGLVNNLGSTVLIDTRDAAKYKAAHIKASGLEAISMPLTDDIFYDNNHQFYKDVEALDPTHSKFILISDEGSNSLTLKVCGVLSSMGWGKEKIYLLMDPTSKFLEKYPDLDSSK